MNNKTTYHAHVFQFINDLLASSLDAAPRNVLRGVDVYTGNETGKGGAALSTRGGDE